MADRLTSRAPCTMAIVTAAFAAAACSASLPPALNVSPVVGAAPPTVPLAASANYNAAHGHPRDVYPVIARQAARCWFGPFGSAHDRYMTSANVPPPTSSEPVTMVVHRRLPEIKKPWGPALLRIAFSGTSTTTLSFENVGLSPEIYARMTDGFTRWAGGSTECGTLHDAQPQWVARPTLPAPQRGAKRK